MKRYEDELVPSGASQEEIHRIWLNNAKRGFEAIKEDLPEIREIFRVQLNKKGNESRAQALEELIKYVYTNCIREYEATTDANCFIWDYYNAKVIYDIADIVKAANENDAESFANLIKGLPWGYTSSSDAYSWMAMSVAYGMLGEEDQEKFKFIIYDQVKGTNMGTSNIVTSVKEMEDLELIGCIKIHNTNSERIIEKALKQSQRGEE